MKTYKTTYATAIEWLNRNIILQNNITEIDPSVWENLDHNIWDEETGEAKEIYQWYITDYNDDDIKWMNENFPTIIFSYSDLLNKWILCVDHWGTSWDYVMIDTKNQYCQREEGEHKNRGH